jgi:hypothetical protein
MSVTQPTAKTVRFKCGVSSSARPKPFIRWFKNGDPIRGIGRVKLLEGSTELVIAQSVNTDMGIYQCMVSNLAGTVTSGEFQGQADNVRK